MLDENLPENPVLLANSLKQGKVNRLYNTKWEADYPWLYFDNHSRRIFVKTPFQNYENALGKDGKLNKHIYSSSHIRSVELEKLALVALKNPVYNQILNQNFEESDESTNINNKSELSICVRFVKNNQPVERFLNIVTLSDTKAQTIIDAISIELIKHNLSYDNIIACGFDGASNMSGNKGGVRRFVSDKAGREVPYIHCQAHVLSLALTSMRNKFPKIKRVFHVLKDIYKLLHQSPKREELLHKIQVILNDPILKIPEVIEIRWLSHYKIVHAIKQSYIAITTTCEHIHQDGADLASLAGGILLSLREESFIVLLCGLDETLGVISNLSLILQRPTICISVLPTLIKSTTCHLYKILEGLKQYAVNKSTIIKNATDISRCSIFEDYKSFSNSSEKIIEQLCDCFSLNENEKNGVLSDYKSFMFVASQKVKTNEYPITDLLEANIGYEHLKKLSESILCIPMGTPTVERLFSAMNRIMTNLRNRMGQDTLQYCMKISIEGDEDPSIEYVEECSPWKKCLNSTLGLNMLEYSPDQNIGWVVRWSLLIILKLFKVVILNLGSLGFIYIGHMGVKSSSYHIPSSMSMPIIETLQSWGLIANSNMLKCNKGQVCEKHLKSSNIVSTWVSRECSNQISVNDTIMIIKNDHRFLKEKRNVDKLEPLREQIAKVLIQRVQLPTLLNLLVKNRPMGDLSPISRKYTTEQHVFIKAFDETKKFRPVSRSTPPNSHRPSTR
ncbi:zinc finger protein 862-like [Aphis craccivora]|uniref:Zinc finger protein 862-like n=1 Tax=Aphis craccivora TaxID=307492 RepID=A0A6G0ZRA3_APHCR|nr:zinc finger protein 862-like [Aphis craccivora]